MMKRILLILALALTVLSSTAAVTMAVKDKNFYKMYNFTWYDASGVQHVNSLADKATDPRHIMALLTTVFTTRQIPGIKYSGYQSDGVTREGSAYYTVGAKKKDSVYVNGWNIPKSNYTPTTEGYTILLVKVKKDFVSSPEDCNSVESTLRYIDSAVESVEMLFGSYNSGDNPGALYRLSGDAHRFFFLSKGRGKRSGANDSNTTVKVKPFFGMFEEISPAVALGGSTIATNDFYATMMRGETYPAVHDCQTVIFSKHDFSMTATKELRPLDDMMFYFPDFRFLAWDDRDVQGNGQATRYTNYNPDFAPVMCVYKLVLTANGEAVEGDESKWSVTLDWTSNLSEAVGVDIEQTYYIYIRNADGTLTPLLGADGKQVTTDQTTYTYQVDRKAEAYDINYVILGKEKKNTSNTMYSNDASVPVPPLGQDNWAFTIGVNPQSDFDLAQELNQYKNYVSLFSDIDTTAIGTYFNMGVSPKFTVYRYPLNHTDGTAVKVATVNITSVTGTGSATQCGYSVTYDNQNGADEAAYPAKTGTLAFGDTLLQVCDQFGASTAINAHPESYEYCVQYSNSNGVNITSPMKKVKVYKTSITTSDQSFTKTYVQNDSVRSAHATETALDTLAPSFSFKPENDDLIYYYSTMRLKSSCDTAEVSRAYRVSDGNYLVYQDEQRSATYAPGKYAEMRGAANEYGTYRMTPVISTFRNDATDVYNTYGAPVGDVARVGLQVEAKNAEKSAFVFYNNSGVKGCYYKVDLDIATLGAVLDGEIVRYRVWRSTPDGKAMEVVNAYLPRLNQDNHPADMYVESGGPVLYPSCRNEFIMQGTHDGETCFPSRYNESTITYTDVFGAKALGDGEEMPVTYVVRVYAQPDDTFVTKPAASIAVGGDTATDDKYYIAENTTVVTFTNSIPTAVMDVDTTAKTPLHVQYVNVLGCTSDTPFSGLNIVVTTFTDGTMMKEKKMF